MHFQATPAVGLMDWELPVGQNWHNKCIFYIKKNNYSVASESLFCGNWCKPQRCQGEVLEIPGVTFRTTSAGFLPTFIAVEKPFCTEIGGLGWRWCCRRSGLLQPRGFQSCALFSCCGNPVVPFPLQSALEAAQENTNFGIFAWLWSVLSLQGPALPGTRGGDEVSPPDPRFLGGGTSRKQILGETEDPKMI